MSRLLPHGLTPKGIPLVELIASEPRLLAQALIAWTVCLAAIAWGGGPERAVAITWLIVFEIGWRVVPSLFDMDFTLTGVDVWRVSCEIVAGVILIGVALYANRNYALWIAAMQLLAMTAHLARGLVESVSAVAYVMMIAVPGWVQLVLLLVGLIRHILRKRKYGPYRDWRTSFANTVPNGDAGATETQADWVQFGRPSWREDIK